MKLLVHERLYSWTSWENGCSPVHGCVHELIILPAKANEPVVPPNPHYQDVSTERAEVADTGKASVRKQAPVILEKDRKAMDFSFDINSNRTVVDKGLYALLVEHSLCNGVLCTSASVGACRDRCYTGLP
jgi:hypothetical protein